MQVDAQKRMVRLGGKVGSYLFLSGQRSHLDEAGLAALRTLEDELLAEPPRLLLAAMAAWDRAGRPWLDPRPQTARVMGRGDFSTRPGVATAAQAAIAARRGNPS